MRMTIGLRQDHCCKRSDHLHRLPSKRGAPGQRASRSLPRVARRGSFGAIHDVILAATRQSGKPRPMFGRARALLRRVPLFLWRWHFARAMPPWWRLSGPADVHPTHRAEQAFGQGGAPCRAISLPARLVPAKQRSGARPEKASSCPPRQVVERSEQTSQLSLDDVCVGSTMNLVPLRAALASRASTRTLSPCRVAIARTRGRPSPWPCACTARPRA